MKYFRILVILLSLSYCSAALSESKYSWGMKLGRQYFSELRNFDNNQILGADFGYRLSNRWGIDSLYLVADGKDENNLTTKISRLHLGGMYYFTPYNAMQVFVNSGIGSARFKNQEVTNHESLVNLGIGILINTVDSQWPISIRYNSYYSTDENLFDNTLTLGISHHFGPQLKTKSNKDADDSTLDLSSRYSLETETSCNPSGCSH